MILVKLNLPTPATEAYGFAPTLLCTVRAFGGVKRTHTLRGPGVRVRCHGSCAIPETGRSPNARRQVTSCLLQGHRVFLLCKEIAQPPYFSKVKTKTIANTAGDTPMHSPALASMETDRVPETMSALSPEVAAAEGPAVEVLTVEYSSVRGVGSRVSAPLAIARGDVIAVAGNSFGAYHITLFCRRYCCTAVGCF